MINNEITLETVNTKSFLPYPSSRLSPVIIPQDLSNFKSRGANKVERELQQELIELKEAYLKVIDAFNWNKLIYESKFNFEPVVGEIYHLYKIEDSWQLSMIEPELWHHKWIGSFRLNSDSRWEPQKISDDFNLQNYIQCFAPVN